MQAQNQAQKLAIQTQLHNFIVAISRARNGAGSSGLMPLMPVPDAGGNPPPAAFPHNLAALRNLSGPHTTILLNFYQLPISGSVIVKRRRLAAHIGATQI